MSQLAAIPRQPGQDIGYRSQAGDIRGRAGAASTHLPHPGRQQGRGRRVQKVSLIIYRKSTKVLLGLLPANLVVPYYSYGMHI